MGNRTPSAWFLPSTNRFALRATAESNPDLGSDSTLSLPMNSWFHLTFVFDNSSDGLTSLLLSSSLALQLVTRWWCTSTENLTLRSPSP
jgi:hypothetical protein